MIELAISADPVGEVAGRLAGAAAAGAHIALSGGSTPRAAYERAASLGGDWSGATLWFGDERCVAPDHEHSNFGMAKSALLDRLEGPAPTVRRIEGEQGAESASAAYERDLRRALGARALAIDLVLLGLGPDAHCASLFPGDAALMERERLAVGVPRPGLPPPVPRVTLTLPVLNAAREVVFLVSGEGKAEAMRRAFSGPPSADAPASLVRPDAGGPTVVCDSAAAALLETVA